MSNADPPEVIRFNCAQCGKSIKVPSSKAGKSGQCPGCGQRLQVPATAPQTSTPENVVPCAESGSPEMSLGVQKDNVEISNNTMGIVGFVISLVGLFLCGVPSIVGTVVSAFALKKKPAGFAIAGLTLGIIGLVGGVIFFFFFAGSLFFATQEISKSRREDTSRSVEFDIKTLGNMCVFYRLQIGKRPNSLDDLVTLPDGMSQAEWQGPHLDGPLPKDPWGREYRYSVGESKDSFTISSDGADGIQGTLDDKNKTF